MKPNKCYKVCMCCGTTYDATTMKKEHIALSDMPAEIAIHVMSVRYGIKLSGHKVKRYRKRKKRYNEL